VDGHAPGGGDEFDLLGYDGLVPDEMTSFVGRDAEIRAARHLLLEEKKPLVTLVGIGGVGKSRLGERIAGELADTGAYADGIILVRLAYVPPTADVIASTIAHRVLGADNATESAWARLIAHFQGQRALLLLDNCEQLVVDNGPLPRLLNILLRATASTKKPTLQVLATSQVKLGAVREQVLNVPPLGIEDALKVFVDRAAAIDQPIPRTAYPLARRLCEATDGIPLALELAAGQLDVLTLQQLVERAEAEDLLPVLVDGTSEQHHHRTMAGSIARSYELLSDTERRGFALLSVFRGGFDLDAAVAVMSHFAIDPAAVEPLIFRLIRRSLLVAANNNGRKRFRMVEVIRQFAQQHVGDAADELDAAHTDYFREFSKRARRSWFGPLEPVWMRAISVDRVNFRVAQQRLLDRPEMGPLGQELGVETVATRAFVFDGRLNEARRMLEAGLSKHPAEPSLVQVTALSLSLWLAVLQGQQELADSLLEQVEKAATTLNCFDTFGPVLYARGTRVGLNATTAVEARAAFALMTRAESALHNDSSFGDEFMAALFGAIIGGFVGEKEVAFSQAVRVLAMARAAQAPWCISWGLWVFALVELIHGDDAGAATRRAQEALAIQLDIGDRWGPTWALWLLALCAIKGGDAERGALLLGGADREQQTSQTRISGLLTLLRAQQTYTTMARKALGDNEFEDLVAVGYAMEREESFELALPSESIDLAVLRARYGGSPEATQPQSVLTERELEVAHLVAQGKTNAEIATELVLSERTVEGHIRAINTKFGTRNRVEITAFMMRHPVITPT
jgi:predicted ATPase/DNA-binding CsgD family transcriptional regulator